jgi:hypothetical protein
MNPFIEINESGYILSPLTRNILNELSGSFTPEPVFFDLAKDISSKYSYDTLLYVILLYVDYALKDNLISEEEYSFIKELKHAFSIVPGDFIIKKPDDVKRILSIQFHLYYLDNIIDFEESKEIDYLKEIFDLSKGQLSYFEIIEKQNKYPFNPGL